MSTGLVAFSAKAKSLTLANNLENSGQVGIDFIVLIEQHSPLKVRTPVSRTLA